MPQLITFLIGLFSSVGPVAKFFFGLVKKVALTAVILPIQIAFIGSIIAFRISLLGFLITLIIFIYNKTVDLLSFLKSELSKNIFTIPYNILDSMGVFQAFSDVFSAFTILFTTLLLAFLSKVAVNSLSQLSDEFYKIGVLLKLGLK